MDTLKKLMEFVNKKFPIENDYVMTSNQNNIETENTEIKDSEDDDEILAYPDFKQEHHPARRNYIGHFASGETLGLPQGVGTCFQQSIFIKAVAENMKKPINLGLAMNIDHAWCEFKGKDGTVYVFDPRNRWVINTKTYEMYKMNEDNTDWNKVPSSDCIERKNDLYHAKDGCPY